MVATLSQCSSPVSPGWNSCVRTCWGRPHSKYIATFQEMGSIVCVPYGESQSISAQGPDCSTEGFHVRLESHPYLLLVGWQAVIEWSLYCSGAMGYISHSDCLSLNTAVWTRRTKDCDLNRKYWSRPSIDIQRWCKVKCRFLGWANPLLRFGESMCHLAMFSTTSQMANLQLDLINTPRKHSPGISMRALPERTDWKGKAHTE